MQSSNLCFFRLPSGCNSADAWFTPWRFAALLALVIFIFFPDVILGTRTFIFRDYGLFGYPLAFYHRESFWRGEVPLWNPLNNCGLPFLAQWNTLVLYPGSLFYLFLPLSWSLGVFCLAHLHLAGLGMYFLARHWTGSRLAGSVAGLGFAFNGFTLSSLMWPHCMASLAWMPFVVLTAERASRLGGRFVIVAAAVGTLQMLAGPPEVVLITWLVAGSLWQGECLFGKLPLIGSLKRFLLVVVIITALATILLLPFLELLRHSQRGVNYGTGEWSMPSTGWANLLVPLFDCYQTRAGPFMQHDQALISSYYTGIGVLALAVFAIGQLRGWKVWLLGAIAVLSLVLALGDAGQLYAWLRRVFPPVGFMRYPVKFVMLTTFATPLLAAYGMRKVLSASPEAKAGIRRFLIVLWLAMLSLILIILWVAHRSPSGRETWTITARNGVERAAFLSLVLATLYRMNRTRESGKQCLLGLAVLVLLWLDIVTHAPSQNPTVERTVYEPGLQPLRELDPRPTLGQSRAMTSYSALWRFHFTLLSDPFNTQLGCRLGLFADCNLLDGLPKVDGFYAIEIKEEFEARETLYLSTNTVPENYMNKDFLSRGIFYVATNNFATNLADFLGVCQITAPGKLFDWEARPTYLPLLSAGQKPVFVDATNSLRGLLEPAFNPRQVVYLPLEARPFITVPNETQARVFPGEFSAHGAVLETVAEAPTMVVAAQAWYPCWKAYVDGQPARVWRANHAYQALQVPGGRHRVELVYRDPSFLSGLAISGLTLIACVIGAFRRK